MKRIVLLLAMAASVAIGCKTRNEAGAIGTTGTNANDNRPAAADTVSRGDRDFVNDLTIANMAEVELAKVALEKSRNPEVKRFGQMMIDDHTNTGDKLEMIATEHHVEMPAGLDQKHMDLRDKLSGLEGAAFDREYMSAMVDGHKDVLDRLEPRLDHANLASWKTQMEDLFKRKSAEQAPAMVAESSDDPTTSAINQWAAESYPVVYRHSQSAQMIYDTVKRAPARTQ